MEIRQEKKGQVLVVGPVGHLDTRTSHDFEKKIVELLGSGERRFIIDLAQLEYVSSAGLRVLLLLAKKLDAMEGELVVSGMNAQVREVFDVAGFTGIFTILATEAEALAKLSSGSKSITDLATKLLGLSKEWHDTGERKLPDSATTLRVSAQAAELLGLPPPKPKPAPPPPPVAPPPPADSDIPEPPADPAARPKWKWFNK